MNTITKKQDFLDIRKLLQEAFDCSPRGHFCHITSVYYHGLTHQVPTRVYVRKPKTGTGARTRPDKLSDLQIRNQFLKPHRRTENVITLGQGEIVLISGSKRDRVGVIPVAPEDRGFPEESHITDLARCLIDAVVAPHYNGGVFSLPEIFENAGESLDPKTLIDHYRHLDFLYPFHQALGFFLDHTGQSHAADCLRYAFPPTNRFFVDRAAKSTWPYDSKWQVHYPLGLVNAH